MINVGNKLNQELLQKIDDVKRRIGNKIRLRVGESNGSEPLKVETNQILEYYKELQGLDNDKDSLTLKVDEMGYVKYVEDDVRVLIGRINKEEEKSLQQINTYILNILNQPMITNLTKWGEQLYKESYIEEVLRYVELIEREYDELTDNSVQKELTLKEVEKLLSKKYTEYREALVNQLDNLLKGYGVDDSGEASKERLNRLRRILDEDIMEIFEEDGGVYLDNGGCKVRMIPTSNGLVPCVEKGTSLYIISQKGYGHLNLKYLELTRHYDTVGDLGSKSDKELLKEYFNKGLKDRESETMKMVLGLNRVLNPKNEASVGVNLTNLHKGLYIAYNRKKEIKEDKKYNESVGKRANKKDKNVKDREMLGVLSKAYKWK